MHYYYLSSLFWTDKVIKGKIWSFWIIDGFEISLGKLSIWKYLPKYDQETLKHFRTSFLDGKSFSKIWL